MKKLLLRKRKFGIYPKLLFSLLITVIAVTIIVSAVLYIDFESKIDEQIYSLAKNSLYQLSQNAEFMASTAKTLSIQLYFDSSISNIMLYENPNNMDTVMAMAQLDLYRLVTPYVESIYIFNSANGNFYISDDAAANTIQNRSEFYDKEIIALLDHYNEQNHFRPITRVITPDPNDIQNPLSSYVYTFIFTGSYMQTGNDNNYVIVNISQRMMHSLIEEQPSDQDVAMIILDENGYVAFNSKNEYSASDELGSAVTAEIMAAYGESAHFISDVQGTRSLIAFIAGDSLGWKYVAVLPYKSIYAKINSLKINTILLISALLLLSFILAPIVAKRLYRPIEKMLQNIRKLETEKRSNAFAVRQDFLRNLVLESDMQDPDELAAKMEAHSVSLAVDGYFTVILFKLDRFFEFYETYNLPERNALRMKLLKQAEAAVPVWHHPVAVDMKEDRIALVINIRQDFAAHNLEPYIKGMQESITQQFGLSLSASLSTVGETIDQVTFLYNQVVEVSSQRLFFGRGCVIFAEDVIALNQQKYDYPYEKEKLLIDSLLAGNKEELASVYHEIIQMLSGCSYLFANMAFSNLVFNINKAIDIIEKNNFPGSPSVFNRLTLTLNDYEVIQDLDAAIIAILYNIIQRVEEKRLTRHDDVIDKINDIITQNYMDQNLSIGLISQELGISASYLCRLYKRYCSITILDHITEVRMQKAKALLEESDMPVSQISINVGFNNSTYFYRCFKKANGITPNEYRQNARHPL